MNDRWDPVQYNRFAAEREQPFWDLAALVEPVERPVVVDLGCGDGRLTAGLHEMLGARHTLGIDSSAAMIAAAPAQPAEGLEFALGDLAAWEEPASSMWPSPTRRCNGCPTTAPCSPAGPSRCDPAANWPSRCRPTPTIPPTRSPPSWPPSCSPSRPRPGGRERARA